MDKVKIPIKKIENPNKRQVCFSKRKMGIFKKASELSIMCGTEIAIIVFSSAGKAFTFGSPNIDFVVDKYQNISVHINDKKVHKSWRSEQQYNFILRELDAEKKHTEMLKIQEGNKQADSWWRRNIEDLELHQLREFNDSLKGLKERIVKVLQEKEPSDKVPNEIEAEQLLSTSYMG
uniref:MADS-box protein 43 n=1 Tax=Cunninghamia lanceolata TaxID=28977 RepID=A0A8F2Z0J8_CUNLA|nr:MADS-box protein 43 [Cunninghamia lanceolata]